MFISEYVSLGLLHTCMHVCACMCACMCVCMYARRPIMNEQNDHLFLCKNIMILTASLMILVTTEFGKFKSSGLSAISF